MHLQSGSRLGHYEIVAPLGAGGMGEVYRAQDTMLGREVAIKVLPEELATHSERLARFEREAKSLAALNHPNIATLYGLERETSLEVSDEGPSRLPDTEREGPGRQRPGGRSRPFLVMELVAGEDLDARIRRRGPIPLDEALAIFLQVAEGLEAAHAKSIIHRDLKPANLRVTEEGRVKILDFGLAKALEPPPDPDFDLSQSPTLTAAATQRGEILGTAAYMSPEQAIGKPVDQRADVWAFGVCLWEAVTGRSLFAGEDAATIRAAVLQQDPDLDMIPAEAPPSLRRLLARCLQRELRDRLHSIADARLELEQAHQERRVPSVATSRRGGARTLTSIALAVVVGLLAGFFLQQAWSGRSTSSKAPQAIPRFVMTLTSPVLSSTRSAMALSPDSRYLAYVSNPGGRGTNATLYLRPLDRLASEPIDGTEGAQAPFFSANGEWIGFWEGTELKKVSIRGGQPEVIGPVRDFHGASWGPDGWIVLSNNFSIDRIEASGGSPEPIEYRRKPTAEVESPRGLHPHFLPGGKAILYESQGSVMALSLETGEQRVVLPQGHNPRYLASGHLLFVQETTVLAAPFDEDSLKVLGPAVPVLENVRRDVDRGGAADLAVSRSGLLLYVAADPSAGTLQWVDRKGESTPIPLETRRLWAPRISPDGTKIAVELRDEDQPQLGLVELERNNLVLQITEIGGRSPQWSPSGEHLAFDSVSGGVRQVFIMPADSSRPPEPLTQGESSKFVSSLSSSAVLWTEKAASTRDDVWALSRDRPRDPFPLATTPDYDGGASFSPDGKWVAWATYDLPRATLLVAPFPGLESPVTVDTGALCPVWSRSSNELFYYDLVDDRLMVASYEVRSDDGGPRFVPSTPKPLFDAHFVVSTDAARPNFDFDPHSQRFLAIRRIQPSSEVNVVQSWFEELELLVSTRWSLESWTR